MGLSIYLENIRGDVRLRRETDYIMPLWYPFLPIVLSVIAIFMEILALSTMGPHRMGAQGYPWLIYSPLGLIGWLLNLYVVYKWIDRRNKHFKRSRNLFSDIISFLRASGGDKVEVHAGMMERTLREAELEEVERSAALWAVLSFIIPFLILYVYHFLNKDFYKHEKREGAMLEDLGRALEALGLAGVRLRRPEEAKDRSTILYIIASVLTLGVFLLYWVYTLTKDPNSHFKGHALWEDELLSLLDKLVKA